MQSALYEYIYEIFCVSQYALNVLVPDSTLPDQKRIRSTLKSGVYKINKNSSQLRVVELLAWTKFHNTPNWMYLYIYILYFTDLM